MITTSITFFFEDNFTLEKVSHTPKLVWWSLVGMYWPSIITAMVFLETLDRRWMGSCRHREAPKHSYI